MKSSVDSKVKESEKQERKKCENKEMDIRETRSHFRWTSFYKCTWLWAWCSCSFYSHLDFYCTPPERTEKTHAGSHRSNNKIFLHRLCAATGFSNDRLNPTPTLNGKMFGFLFAFKKFRFVFPVSTDVVLWITGFHRLLTWLPNAQ